MAESQELPNSIEAEEAVLGSLLLDPDVVFRLEELIKPDDFFIIKHGWVYEACLQLSRRREPLDVVLLCEELENQSRLEAVGGAAFIAGLISAVPTALHYEAYAKIVAATAQRRRYIAAAGRVAEAAFDEGLSVKEVRKRAESLILEVSGRDAVKSDPEPLSALVSRYFDYVSQVYQGSSPIGVLTGFVDLDRLLGGLHRSDLLYVAGRPSMGKSALLLSMILNITKTFGKTVALFSLEMSKHQLVQRLVSAESGVDGQKLRLGDLNELDWPAIVDASGELSKTSVWVDDTAGLNPMQLRAKCRRLDTMVGLDVVMVDYLQLMAADRPTRDRVGRFTEISQALKELARELDVPVVAASQLSRSCEYRVDKRPVLADLRETGALEADSDVVMFIYRDEMYDPATPTPNIAEIRIAKHRSGPIGQIILYFNKRLTRFQDATAAQHPQPRKLTL